MKKIILLLFITISMFFSIDNSFAIDSDIYGDIWSASSPGIEENVENSTIKNGIVDSISSWNKLINVSWNSWIDIISSIFVWFKWEIFSVVMVLSVWVFIFIGIRMASSRWKPDEFKKALLHFVYAVVWIFMIFMAWWLVKLVSSLSL